MSSPVTSTTQAGMNAILYKDFDVSQVNFEPITKNKLGGKLVRLSYGPNKLPIRIQTPDLYIPFDPMHHDDNGATSGPPSDSADGVKTCNFTFEVSMTGYNDTNSRVKTFYDKMVELDELIVRTCVERSPDWLGEQKKKDVVDEFHRKLVRQKNPKYSPLMKIKVTPVRLDGTLPKVFDISDPGNKSELDLGVLTKGVRGKFILAIQSVWFVNKTFGITAKMIQAAVTHRPSSNMSGYAFIDDDSEGPVPASGNATSMVPQVTNTILDDTDLDF